MNRSTGLLLAMLASAVAGTTCAQGVEEPPARADAVRDARAQTDTALDAISEGADTALDATKDAAAAAGRQATAAVSATGAAITDSWITTKITAGFIDEALLTASDIDVGTDDHVVTLTGTVRSDAAKVRAAAIARSTEGVTRVVDQLVVTSN
jgi:osmotically-inducible protein OsmY